MTATRALSVLRLVLLFAVLGSVGYAAARTAWHRAGETAILPEAVPAAQPAEAPPAVDTASIKDAALFGSAAVVPEKPVETAAETPETDLALTLRGILIDPDPARSTALIAHEGQTAAYFPGDTVIDEVVLIDVGSRAVTIRVRGQDQSLSFPNSADAAAGDADAAPEEDDGFARLRASLVVGNGSINASKVTDPKTTEDYIDLWRDRIIRNPGEVLDRIGLVPTGNGYRIAEEHDSGVALAGLKAGDVVTSVNGQAVGDVDRDRELFDQVAASGTARLSIQRNGETITMSFPLR